MKITLGQNAYGKNAVNLSKIIRRNNQNELRHISVSISLTGEFETAHMIGDNTKILPTDTMKNTVYALAKEHFIASTEEYGIFLANYFLANNKQVSEVKIEITEHLWNNLTFENKEHPNAYISRGAEKHTVAIIHSRTGTDIWSGVKDLLILKTTDSAFKDYIRDDFTTLKETDDRIMSTQCEISWLYSRQQLDFTTIYNNIHRSLLKTFADHKSLSVQHTMYAMGETILKQYEAVKEITFKMPNKHHLLFNLEQFGMENNNEIFMPTDEPFGLISGTITREE